MCPNVPKCAQICPNVPRTCPLLILFKGPHPSNSFGHYYYIIYYISIYEEEEEPLKKKETFIMPAQPTREYKDSLDKFRKSLVRDRGEH